jgi:uncharacterized protein (TIGR02996 family)
MRVTTTLASLLRAVCVDPSDDFRRLVLADALDDDGDAARAEFVRVQVELSRINPGPDEHARASNLLRRYHKGAPIRMRARTPATLLAREAILLDECGEKWFRADRGMDPFCPVERNAWMFRPVRSMTPFSYWLGYVRGLLGRFDGPLADWLAHGPAIVSQAPVEAVVLADKEPIRVTERVWFYRRSGTVPPPDANHVPAFLHKMLYPGMRQVDPFHRSREEAEAAFSAVLVSHARSLAGLPPPP